MPTGPKGERRPADVSHTMAASGIAITNLTMEGAAESRLKSSGPKLTPSLTRL
jgi:hypothetical protein